MNEGPHTSGPERPFASSALTRSESPPQLTARDAALLRAEAATERAERLIAFTAVLAETWTSERVAASAIEQGRIAARALDASLWIADRARGVARLAEATHRPEIRDRFGELPLDPPGRLPVADAIRSARPIWIATRAEFHRAYPALAESAQYGQLPGLGIACLPLVFPSECIGAVVFTFGEDDALDDAERMLLLVLARHVSLAIERARLYDAERAARAEAEAAEARSAFLSEAAHVLASSLDYETTLATVARLAVPRIADWCAIDLADDFWAGRPAAIVAHADPAMVARARALQRDFPADPRRRSGVPEVLRSGAPEVYPEITEEMIRASAFSPEHAAAALALEIRSAMIVPMIARGRVLGAISFVSSRAGRHGASDLETARHLARRAGLAVDNAKLYEEARRALAARDRTLAFVSHDLKNPLNAMMMATSMLERGDETPEARARHLSVMRRAGIRMERLIRDLLDLSSLEAGRLGLRPRASDAETLVADALAHQAPLAESAGVALDGEVAPGLPRVEVDRDRIQQVLSNLIGNALAFTPRGGAVTVRCRREGGAVRFEIADTGRGIAPADQRFVFDAFWRAADSHQGTGLGLAIARGLVEAHGGRIGFESAPGRGTTFHFTVPLSPEDAAGAGRERAPVAWERPGPVDPPSG